MRLSDTVRKELMRGLHESIARQIADRLKKEVVPWRDDDPLPPGAGSPWMTWIDETDNGAAYPLEDYEDPHAGQIYNEYTGEWVWL